MCCLKKCVLCKKIVLKYIYLFSIKNMLGKISIVGYKLFPQRSCDCFTDDAYAAIS